jgi:hypothetical protein
MANKPNFWQRQLIGVTELINLRNTSLEALAWLAKDAVHLGCVSDGLKPSETNPISMAVQITPGRIYFPSGLHGTLSAIFNLDMTSFVPVNTGKACWAMILAQPVENGYTPIINFLGDEVYTIINDEVSISVVLGAEVDQTGTPVKPTNTASDALVLGDVRLWQGMFDVDNVDYTRRVVPPSLQDIKSRLLQAEQDILVRSLATHKHDGSDIVTGLVDIDRIMGVHWNRIPDAPANFPTIWSLIDPASIPQAFAPSDHTHSMTDINGLVQALQDIQTEIGHLIPSIPATLYHQTQDVYKDYSSGLYYLDAPNSNYGTEFQDDTNCTGTRDLFGNMVSSHRYGVRLSGHAHVHCGGDYFGVIKAPETLLVSLYVFFNAAWHIAGQLTITADSSWVAVGDSKIYGEFSKIAYFNVSSQGLQFETAGAPSLTFDINDHATIGYRIKANGFQAGGWSTVRIADVTLTDAIIFS